MHRVLGGLRAWLTSKYIEFDSQTVYQKFESCILHHYLAKQFSWLERQPVTLEVEGSSPFLVAIYAAVAQQVERILGKDEVGGSNPPSSSKKSCFREKTGLFLYFLTNLICGSRCGTVLTHTVTHTRKCAERAKKERKGSSAIYQMAFATFNAQYAYSFIF